MCRHQVRICRILFHLVLVNLDKCFNLTPVEPAPSGDRVRSDRDEFPFGLKNILLLACISVAQVEGSNLEVVEFLRDEVLCADSFL